MNQVVQEYLERFNQSMTESVLGSRSMEDYNKMKKYCDYLDYDKLTLFRERQKSQAGLRNIGNTCYLNVILQLLFHINYLREKICCSEQNKSKLIQVLRMLFGEMAVGKLLFADPTALFQHLRDNNSDIFMPGVQNDFHQIFTLLIDKISESYKQTSVEQARFISKLLFGKLITKIDYTEGNASSSSSFNIINLEVVEGSFDKAFQKWKKYKIIDYVTPKVKLLLFQKSVVEATAQNMFLQTPALMTFFINRVSYRNNKLEKDNRLFQFQDSIRVNKSQSAEKAKLTKLKAQQMEQELSQEKSTLMNWLVKIEKQRNHLQQTLKYMKQKQIPLLSQPSVASEMDQQNIPFIIGYLTKQIDLINLKMEEVRNDLIKIQNKMAKLEEDGNYQTYTLWALMIHLGSTANFGHYKICIKFGQNQWHQYNDRTVSIISQQRIQSYKKNGQICCLFYRRPTLICDNNRIPVTYTLKNMVNQQQRLIAKQIDKSRMLQSLYQQTESSKILLEYELQLGIQQKYSFFFKTVHYAIIQQFSFDTCRGIIIFQNINAQSYKNALSSKFISEQSKVDFTRIKFGVTDDYFNASENIKNFLDKQSSFVELGVAYEQLSNKKVKFIKKIIKDRYTEMLQIIVLKGIFYMKLLADNYSVEVQPIYQSLSNAIDKLLSNMDAFSEFVLVIIAIKSDIRKVNDPTNLKKLKLAPKQVSIEDYGQYFTNNFNFWIQQRHQLSKLDESTFYKNAPIQPFLRD